MASRFSFKVLFVAMATLAYATLLGFFLGGFRDDIFKIPVIVGGVVLAALIPELLKESKPLLRAALIIIPILGVAASQLIDAQQTAVAAARLSNSVNAFGLKAQRDQIRSCEVSAREQVNPDPRDSLRSLSFMDQSLNHRANILATRAAIHEARVSNMAVPESSRVAEQDFVRLLRDEEARYRAAASFFQQSIKPVYSAFQNEGQTNLSDDERNAQLRDASKLLEDFSRDYPSAGLSGRLGLLAIARARPDEALFFYYSGLREDPSNLGIYESLGHAGWVLNQDSRVGLRYAEAGARLTEDLADLVHSEIEETLSALPKARADELRLVWKDVASEWSSYIDGYRQRFALQEAYYNALDLTNEARAREKAEALLKADPNDPEYQDAMAFVLLRFAHDIGELRRAEGLLLAVKRSNDAEHTTDEGVVRHLDQVRATISEVESGGNAGAIAGLASKCA